MAEPQVRGQAGFPWCCRQTVRRRRRIRLGEAASARAAALPEAEALGVETIAAS